MRRAARLAALAAALATPVAARAHEALHEVRRGGAVAVRAYLADGAPLAYAGYEVYSPADPRVPHQKGRTDRNGWLAFVPDAPGRWHVKVVEEGGHGLELDVDATPAAEPAADHGGPSAAAFVLRPVAALLALAALFAAIFLVQRRRAARR